MDYREEDEGGSEKISSPAGKSNNPFAYDKFVDPEISKERKSSNFQKGRGELRDAEQKRELSHRIAATCTNGSFTEQFRRACCVDLIIWNIFSRACDWAALRIYV